jgi:hypothetical protein
MIRIGKLYNASVSSFSRISMLYLKSSNELVNPKNYQLVTTQFRSSHGRQMFIRPGKFYTKKYFDILVLVYF